jgi:hypothetical protein
MTPSTPFSRLPQPDPPRGKRRSWPADYTLPTRLELRAHGLYQRGMACYGFSVWDVGQNRLLIRHGAPIGHGQGPGAAVDAAAAGLHALLEGLSWLIREDEHRRRLLVCTDDPIVYTELQRDGPPPAAAHGFLVRQVISTLARCPHHALQLIAADRNVQAIGAADDAFVAAQEAERLARAPEVLPELHPVGPYLYLVGDRYRVDLAAGTCTCPDFRTVHTERHPIRCKHLLAALQLAGRTSPPAPDQG